MPGSTEYMVNYQRKRYAERKAWAHALLGGVCAQCGETDGTFEVDHIDPTEKSFQVSIGYSKYSQERLAAELEKCQLLCAECHAKKSRKDRAMLLGHNEYWQHGSLTGYSHHKCRCELCREANSEYYREYRRRRKEES